MLVIFLVVFLGISIDDVSVSRCYAGDQVVVNVVGVDMGTVYQGCVLCHANSQIRSTQKFQAKIVVFNIDKPITIGYPVSLPAL